MNRSAFWDGSALLLAQETKRYGALKALFESNNGPPSYCLHRFVGLFPVPIVAYRVIYLSCIVFTGFLVYRILINALATPRLVALMAGILSTLMPFSIISFDISLVAASLLMLSFLAGLDLLLVPTSLTPAWQWMRRLAAVGLLALSFFYGTFLFIAMLAAAVSVGSVVLGRIAFAATLVRLRRWPDLHVLPFAFAGIQRLFSNSAGRYGNYNKPTWPDADQWISWLQLPGKYGRRLYEVVWPTVPPEDLLLIVILAIAGGLLVLAAWAGKSEAALVERWPWRRRIVLVGAGLLLVYICALPYLLVGRRDISFVGYISRDNLPVGPPAAALLAGLLYLIPRAVRVPTILAGMLAIRLIFVQANLSKQWLNEELKLNTIGAALVELPEVRDAGVVIYEENVTRFQHLEWLEFQELLARTFGTETRIAFPTWELDRCPSLVRCVELFMPRAEDPISEIAGARDARGCGRVTKVQIEDQSSRAPSWSDYAVGHSGGPRLVALAQERLRVVTSPLADLPCKIPSPAP